MAISVDNQQRLGHFGFDSSLPYTNSPHFTNPWAATSSPAAQSSQYMTPTSSQLDAMAKQQAARANNVSLPYSSVPVSAPDMMNGQRLSNASSYDTGYASASSPSAFATSAVTSAPYSSMGYVTAQNPPVYGLPQAPATERRLSHPTAADPYQESQRQRENSLAELNKGFAAALQSRDFGDAALDAGRGMVAMSQNTPRNLYESRVGRTTNDYFPVAHSANSSISSGSYNPSYYAGSVDSSTDYSSAAESVDSHTSRTLPRPSGLLNANVPPAPSSMMGQFNSKVSTSSQKKHKCKVCEKRFTRPSSLQTHMYSHTGEKPYSCDVPGCGRHFSVVSNLRRHRKVHKGETRDASEDF